MSDRCSVKASASKLGTDKEKTVGCLPCCTHDNNCKMTLYYFNTRGEEISLKRLRPRKRFRKIFYHHRRTLIQVGQSLSDIFWDMQVKILKMCDSIR